jgi:hypothetical protein
MSSALTRRLGNLALGGEQDQSFSMGTVSRTKFVYSTIDKPKEALETGKRP